MVYRGYSYAGASGGVAYAYASNDASYTNAHIGSRLANKQRKNNRRTVAGMYPYFGAEGNKPQ